MKAYSSLSSHPSIQCAIPDSHTTPTHWNNEEEKDYQGDDDDIAIVHLGTIDFHRFLSWKEESLVGLQFAYSLDWEDGLSASNDDDEDDDDDDDDNNNHKERNRFVKDIDIQQEWGDEELEVQIPSISNNNISTLTFVSSNSTNKDSHQSHALPLFPNTIIKTFPTTTVLSDTTTVCMPPDQSTGPRKNDLPQHHQSNQLRFFWPRRFLQSQQILPIRNLSPTNIPTIPNRTLLSAVVKCLPPPTRLPRRTSRNNSNENTPLDQHHHCQKTQGYHKSFWNRCFV
jgi:hypothetical protein